MSGGGPIPWHPQSPGAVWCESRGGCRCPGVAVPNGLCGRKATLNLNVTSCWGGGWGVEMSEVGIVQISDRYITQSAEQTVPEHMLLSHPQSEKSVPGHVLCLTHSQRSQYRDTCSVSPTVREVSTGTRALSHPQPVPGLVLCLTHKARTVSIGARSLSHNQSSQYQGTCSNTQS